MMEIKNPLDRQYRIMSSMILHELEITLGKYVYSKTAEIDFDNPEGLYADIIARIGAVSSTRPSIKSIIEASYLDEIFTLATMQCAGKNEEAFFKYLKQLFAILDVYTIRNCISHPNRVFMPCYYYRLASIASDPVLKILGFESVYNALLSAEAGIISEPPSDWLSKIKWSIANNLPEYKDHEITGLVGRNKEVEKLKKLLKNGKNPLISVQAYGGLGKTALVLQTLSDISEDNSFSELYDQILYFSAKSQELNISGETEISHDFNKIDNLIENIFDYFDIESVNKNIDSLPQTIKNQKVLFCIDNIEDILLKYGSSFDEFYQNIPKAWSVVVTSRIAVNGAHAFPLGPLSVDGSSHLAREYYLRRSGQRLDDSVVSKIASNSNGNPLAIRLIIDSIMFGKSVEEANLNTKESILSFSYSNLIGALPADCMQILECMFVLNRPVSMAEVSSILSIAVDKAAQAFSMLSNTALLHFSNGSGGEQFELNTSVRELMLISPINIEYRINSEELIRSQRKIINQNMGSQRLHEAHIRYIDKTQDESVVNLVEQASRIVSKRASNAEKSARELYEKIKQRLQIEPQNRFCIRAFALVLEFLKDKTQAKYHLEKLSNPGSPIFDLPGAVQLIKYYTQDQEIDKASNLIDALFDAGYGDHTKRDPASCRDLHIGRMRTWLYKKKYENVFEFTKNWESLPHDLQVCHGLNRAETFRRSIENEYWRKVEAEGIHPALFGLISAAKILEKLENDGTLRKDIAIEGVKLIEQMAYAASRIAIDENTAEIFIAFVMKYYNKFICYDSSNYILNEDERIKCIKTIGCLNVREDLKLGFQIQFQEELKIMQQYECDGYEIKTVWVYHIPNTHPVRSLWAKDKNDVQYYIPQHSFDGTVESWRTIQKDDCLIVHAKPNEQIEGKAIPCSMSKLV